MSAETLVAIEQALHDLSKTSFVAHRETVAALPAIRPSGEEATLEWLRACQQLFAHDRDGGKIFMRGSVAAVEASGKVTDWTRQALRFIAWRGSWKALEGFMENLPDAYRTLGEAGEARWSEIGLGWCERHLDSGIAYFRTPISRLTAKDADNIEALMAPAAELFDTRRLALGSYIDGAIRVRDLLGVDAVAAWARQGADIMQAGRLRGEAFFRLESEESTALLLESLPGFHTTGAQRLLQLILLAWFSEQFDLYAAPWAPGQGRAFIETDGIALYVPVAMPSREEALLAALHSAGHLVFHSYERRYIEALFKLAGREHPPLDSAQRITWRPLFAAYGDDMIRFQLIFDLCEDFRVDAAISRVIPNYLERMLAAGQVAEGRSGPAAEYYRLAHASLRHMREPSNEPELIALDPLREHGATIVDAFKVANDIYRGNDLPAISLAERAEAYLPGRSPNAARPVYPRRTLDHAEFGTGEIDREDELKNKAIRPNPEQREIPKLAQGDDPDFDIPPEETSGSGGRVGVGIPQTAHVKGHARGPAYSEKGVPYDEWDYRDNRFKRNWAWIQERELSEKDLPMATRLLEQHGAALTRLKRAIQAQKPTRIQPLRRQYEGDELDIEAVINFVTEKRAGMAPKPTLYRRRTIQQRDTAVLLLADLSTSIMQQAEGGGRVVDRIRAGLLLFSAAMEEIGDAYAIAGFASKYRDNVSYYPIKDFGQKMDTAMRATIGGLSGRLATRMGTAIRHATRYFEQSSSERRLLLILSDGRPADYDDGGDERYLHEDTRMAVKQASDLGVHAFCITLDPAGGEYLSRIFGPGHYLVLDHINDLPKKLPEMYLKLRA